MLADRPASTADEPDRPVVLSALRGIEAEVLLCAVTALHLDGILSEAEYQAKCQRLAAQR